MSRNLGANVQTAIAASQLVQCYLVFLDFDSDPVYATSAPFDITYDSNTYLGVGNLGSIDLPEEKADLSAHQVQVALSGVASSNISRALAGNYQGRAAKIWRAYLDSSHAVIDDPVLEFDGTIDTMNITYGAQAVVAVRLTSELAKWERANILRYSNADQQQLYAGDEGFEFAEQMVDKELVWGQG